MKVIDLLNKIANEAKVPYIRYFNKKEQKEMIMLSCKENIIYRLNENAIDLNDEVIILDKNFKEFKGDIMLDDETHMRNTLDNILYVLERIEDKLYEK